VQRLTQRLQQHWAHALDVRRMRLASVCQVLRSLDPQQVLERGYVLVSDVEGTLVKRAQDVMRGQTLALQFASGTVRARVSSVTKASSQQ